MTAAMCKGTVRGQTPDTEVDNALANLHFSWRSIAADGDRERMEEAEIRRLRRSTRFMGFHTNWIVLEFARDPMFMLDTYTIHEGTRTE